MQEIRILKAGKRLGGKPLEIGALVEMQPQQAADWIKRGWAVAPGGSSGGTPARRTPERSEKGPKRLAKKHGSDTKGLSAEELQAAVEQAEEKNNEEDEAGTGNEGAAEADGQASGGDGDTAAD